MRDRISFFTILLTVVLTVSCREVFYPDDIVSEERIPVIQGNILENQRPVVLLSWAANYEGSSTDHIGGANVWITDDSGNSKNFTESAPGRYQPEDETYTGTCGRKYVLHVEIDGEFYESYPETINPAPVVDSLYAVPVKEDMEFMGSSGSVFIRNIEGLNIYASLTGTGDSTCFLKFHTDVTKEITYYLNPNSLSPIKVYEWSTYTIDNIYSVRHTYKREQKQVLPGHFTGFLEFDYNSSLESEAQSAPYTDGWVVSMHVYTVTPNIYQYYMSIGQQLNVNNSIFAPVPSQIKGNIKCVSDEYGKVIGAFEASTELVCHKGFSWVDENKYRSVVLDSFPENPDMGSVRNIPPSFWVSF